MKKYSQSESASQIGPKSAGDTIIEAKTASDNAVLPDGIDGKSQENIKKFIKGNFDAFKEIIGDTNTSEPFDLTIEQVVKIREAVSKENMRVSAFI